jgi:hypothetical protein
LTVNCWYDKMTVIFLGEMGFTTLH